MGLLEEIMEMVKKEGISICGYANLEGMPLPQQARGLRYGISLGFRLSHPIIDAIIDKPTREYLNHYQRVNLLLDQVALKVVSILQENGYNALPIPASFITDWKEIRADISHKLIATKAGLAWIGRSSLAITPLYGARIRYASILTDLPLPRQRELDFGCGDCKRCIEICPASAILEESEKFNKIACLSQLKSFAKACNLGTHYICGLCVKVCKGGI